MTGATSATSWTNVAEVLSISGPAPTVERIDVTAISSTSKYRSYIGGFADAGVVGFEINYDPDDATHGGTSNGLPAKLNSGTTEQWRVLVAGATANPISFNGYVSGFSPTFNVGEQVKATAEITLSSSVSWPS
jgi:hypothetical protein